MATLRQGLAVQSAEQLRFPSHIQPGAPPGSWQLAVHIWEGLLNACPPFCMLIT